MKRNKTPIFSEEKKEKTNSNAKPIVATYTFDDIFSIGWPEKMARIVPKTAYNKNFCRLIRKIYSEHKTLPMKAKAFYRLARIYMIKEFNKDDKINALNFYNNKETLSGLQAVMRYGEDPHRDDIIAHCLYQAAVRGDKKSQLMLAYHLREYSYKYPKFIHNPNFRINLLFWTYRSMNRGYLRAGNFLVTETLAQYIEEQLPIPLSDFVVMRKHLLWAMEDFESQEEIYSAFLNYVTLHITMYKQTKEERYIKHATHYLIMTIHEAFRIDYNFWQQYSQTNQTNQNSKEIRRFRLRPAERALYQLLDTLLCCLRHLQYEKSDAYRMFKGLQNEFHQLTGDDYKIVISSRNRFNKEQMEELLSRSIEMLPAMVIDQHDKTIQIIADDDRHWRVSKPLKWDSDQVPASIQEKIVQNATKLFTKGQTIVYPVIDPNEKEFLATVGGCFETGDKLLAPINKFLKEFNPYDTINALFPESEEPSHKVKRARQSPQNSNQPLPQPNRGHYQQATLFTKRSPQQNQAMAILDELLNHFAPPPNNRP